MPSQVRRRVCFDFYFQVRHFRFSVSFNLDLWALTNQGRGDDRNAAGRLTVTLPVQAKPNQKQPGPEK